MLVANKCDLTQEREVSEAEGAELANQLGCPFVETSARTAHNVERLFKDIIYLLRMTETIGPGSPRALATKSKRSKCVIM